MVSQAAETFTVYVGVLLSLWGYSGTMKAGDLVDFPGELNAGQLVMVMLPLRLLELDHAGYSTSARHDVQVGETLLCLGPGPRRTLLFLHGGKPVMMGFPWDRFVKHELRLVR